MKKSTYNIIHRFDMELVDILEKSGKDCNLRRECLPTGQDVYRSLYTGQFAPTVVGNCLPSRHARREYLNDDRIVHRDMENGQFIPEEIADYIRRPHR